MKKKNSKSAKNNKKAAAPVQKSPYPVEWLYLHPEEVSVEQLRDYFSTVEELDVECWKALGVLEVTFPSKRYIDFEMAPLPLGDESVDTFAAQKGAKSLYMVSAEPICTRDELDLLRRCACELGGCFAADTEDFQPLPEG